MHNNYIPSAPATVVPRLLELYPQDITQGSPFDTGILNVISPQFKRMAAVVGDLVFQAPRRFFLDNRASKQPTWSYREPFSHCASRSDLTYINTCVAVSKRAKGIPVLGALHASDLLNSFFLGGELLDYVIRFTVNLDPNVGAGKGINWPKYDTTGRNLLTFLDGLIPQTITKDTYRKEGFDYLTSLSLQYAL